jgi:hypothetical protein
MIGLLGAKIWKENRVDFANPINLVPLAAGIIIAIGNNRSGDTPLLVFSEDFSLGGIALGTIVAVAGWHIARALAPEDMKTALTREGVHPAAGTTFGHVHGAEIGPDVLTDRDGTAYREAPDPSSVDEVGRPGVPGTHTTGEGKHNR